jgi:hypothetical protein
MEKIKDFLVTDKARNIFLVIITALFFYAGYNISIEQLPVNHLEIKDSTATAVDSSSIDSTTLFLNHEDTINAE